MQQPGQNDGFCLKFPDNIGVHRELKVDNAMAMLLRAIDLAQRVPFQWGYIDKPPEGQAFLIFLPSNSTFPADGIRYQEMETRFSVPFPNGREMEVHEVKYGFVPGQDTMAWRVRRRFRLIRGGNPALVLVHYTKLPGGSVQPIVPSLMTQPVRAYPLRQVNEPPVFIAGENTGRKVFPPGIAGGGPQPGPPGMPGGPPPLGNMGMSMGMAQQQAMLAQQNNAMEILERKREQQRAREGPPGARMPRVDDDESGDEMDTISTRTLALNRYRRNHEFMNEVFMHAAFGDKNKPERPSPYSNFDKAEVEEKTEKLSAEIGALRARAAERKAERAKLAEQTASILAPIPTEPVGT